MEALTGILVLILAVLVFIWANYMVAFIGTIAVVWIGINVFNHDIGPTGVWMVFGGFFLALLVLEAVITKQKCGA